MFCPFSWSLYTLAHSTYSGCHKVLLGLFFHFWEGAVLRYLQHSLCSCRKWIKHTDQAGAKQSLPAPRMNLVNTAWVRINMPRAGLRVICEQGVDLSTAIYHWDLDLCVYSHFYVITSVLNADQLSLKRTGMIKFPLYWWVNRSHRKTSWFVQLASQDGIRDSQFPVCCSSDWWNLFPFPSSNVYPKPIKNNPSYSIFQTRTNCTDLTPVVKL